MRPFAKSFYKSSEWRVVRLYCLMRDNYLCVNCGMPAEEVHHVVHLSPENIHDPNITLNPKNLQCLCRKCHAEEHRGEHGNGRKVKESSAYEFDENGMLVPKPPRGGDIL